MDPAKALASYGLNTHESAIYLYLIEHLESNVTELQRGTNIPRATIYKVLDQLESQSLVSKFKKNKVLHFTPTSINQLEKNLQTKLSAVQTIIPNLRSLVSTAGITPNLEFLSGKDNVQHAYEQMYQLLNISLDKKLYIISGSKDHTIMRSFLQDWKEKISESGTTTQILRPESSRIYSNKVTIPRIERKFFPDEFNMSGSIHIWDDYIVLVTPNPSKPHATIIQSRELSEMMKNIWSFMWSISKE